MNRFSRTAAAIGAFLLLVWGFASGNQQPDKTWLVCLAGAGILMTVALWPRRTRGLPVFGRTLLRWTSILTVAFLLVSVQLVRVQVVESKKTLDRVGTASNGDVVMDPRRRLAQVDVHRGRILDANGHVLAETQRNDDGSWQRVWPEPAAWGLTGYYSPLLYGSSGLEAAYDEYLTGRSGGSAVRQWLDGVLHIEHSGYDVKLSIDLSLQQQAEDLLAGRPGAVVLMDANTGAVLAMAGSPDADPNQLYANVEDDGAPKLDAVRAYWDQLNADTNAPLVFRPTQGLYTPGSTFKSVTASAEIDAGLGAPDTVFRDEGLLDVDGRVIEELNRPDPNQANWTLEQAYAYSLNVVFAQVGLQVGPERLWEYASRFGFGDQIPFDLPTATTQLANDESALGNRALLADTGFGQGQILTSPLQMALVVSAVANDGKVPRPWLVEDVQGQAGNVVESFDHGTWRTVMDGDSAAAVRGLMLASADYGYANAAAIDGATVGAKTGTAEVGDGDPHSWFTAFAEKDERTLVVAVIVEHGGAGSKTALPIGRELLASALGLTP